jgi:hypothetical protein
MNEEPCRTRQIIIHVDGLPVRHILHTIPDEWVYLLRDGDSNIYTNGGLTMDHHQIIGSAIFEYIKPQLQKEPNTLAVASAYNIINKIWLKKEEIGYYRVIELNE